MVTRSCYRNENSVYRELNEREIRTMGGGVGCMLWEILLSFLLLRIHHLVVFLFDGQTIVSSIHIE